MAVSEVIDEGGLPGPTNGDHSHPDLVDSYLINGFGIGYCDESPAGMSSFRTRFYESYQVCQFTMPPPVAVIDLGGLPGAGSCWIVTVDLQGTPEEFCLAADGGSASPGGDNDPDLDRFAWSYEPTGSSSAGLLIACNPLATDAGYTIPAGSFAPPPRAATGTFFGPPLQCAPSGGSGYLTNDTFLFMGPPQGHRCAYFGGYRNHNGCGAPTGSPYASFHVKLYTQAGVTCDGSSFGMQYCVSTPNSTGGTGDLQIFGSAAASADGEAMVASGLAPGVVRILHHLTHPGLRREPRGQPRQPLPRRQHRSLRRSRADQGLGRLRAHLAQHTARRVVDDVDPDAHRTLLRGDRRDLELPALASGLLGWHVRFELHERTHRHLGLTVAGRSQ